MNSIANTISLIARKASSNRRIGWWTQGGVRFDELARPIGTAAITASTVPQTAMCRVTSISRR